MDIIAIASVVVAIIVSTLVPLVMLGATNDTGLIFPGLLLGGAFGMIAGIATIKYME
jgi:hypothetical protein